MENTIRVHLYGKCQVPADWHMNENILVNRLYVFYDGNGYCQLNNKLLNFEPGYLYLIPNNLNIKLINDRNKPLTHLFFDFFIFPNIVLDEPIKLKLSEYPILRSYVKVFETLFESYNISNVLGTYEPIKGFISTLKRDLNNLLFYINEISPLHQLSDSRINTAVSYIFKHYAENITVEQLAKLTHTEINHFIKIFKKMTSKTPYQYIKDYRLVLAVSMLETGMHPSDIAEKVGYESIFSFSNAIKKKFGKSPSQIQQQLSESRQIN